MAIKIRKDGQVYDLVLQANEIQVLDKNNHFAGNNVESVLNELWSMGGTGGGGGVAKIDGDEYIFVSDTEPEYDGIWLDTSDDSKTVEDSTIIAYIRNYIDTNIKKVVDANTVKVNEIKEKVGDKLDVVSQLSNPNLLINGDFQVNNQGLNSLTKDGYLANRWLILKHLDDTDGIIEHYNREIILSNVKEDLDKNYMYLSQRFDGKDLSSFAGRTITFSADCRCESLTKGGYFLQIIYEHQDEEKNQDVPSRRIIKVLNNSNMTIEYTRHHVSLAIPCNIKSISFEIGCYYDSAYGGVVNKSAKFYMTNVKAEVGNLPTQFYPKAYAQELQDCLMYDGYKLTIPYSNPNLLINGDFQVWQRGTNFAYNGSVPTQCNIYTADRWRVVQSSPDATFTIGKGNSSNGSYFSIVNMNKPSNMLLTLHQKLEPYHLQSGIYTLSYECCHTSTISTRARIYSFGRQSDVLTSNVHKYDGSGNWQKYTHTFQLTNEDISNTLEISFDLGINEVHTNGSFFIRNVKLELGTVATPFTPRPYSEELAMCKRYLYRFKYLTHLRMVAQDANSAWFWFPTGTSFRTTPTGLFGSESIEWYMMTPNVIPNSGWTLSIDTVYEDGVLLKASKNNHGMTDITLKIQSDRMYLDAEIY